MLGIVFTPLPNLSFCFYLLQFWPNSFVSQPTKIAPLYYETVLHTDDICVNTDMLNFYILHYMEKKKTFYLYGCKITHYLKESVRILERRHILSG